MLFRSVTMIVLAQLSREAEREKDALPRLSQIADSTQIERDADVALLLHRSRDEARGRALLMLAKQRNGSCGNIDVWYEGPFTRFEDRRVELE